VQLLPSWSGGDYLDYYTVAMVVKINRQPPDRQVP
jgi:hypothetical protein